MNHLAVKTRLSREKKADPNPKFAKRIGEEENLKETRRKRGYWN